MHRLAAALAALALGTAAPAQAPAQPPRLVIVISVDQLTSALFDEYRPHFTGGLGRLARGAVFRNGRHASSSGSGLGALVERASPDSKTVAVSGERPAASAALEGADQRWYWTGARFATDTERPRLPRSVALATAAVATMVASPDPGLEPPPVCSAKAGAANRFARAAGDYAGFTGSPALDGATLALAASLIGELGLGRDGAPDVVSIDLAGTGNVGSRFGGGPGDGTCVQLLSLDRDLAGFFNALDRAGLDYAVALSGADSSAEGRQVPIMLWRTGFAPAERPDSVATADLVPTLAALLGIRLEPAATGGKCISGLGGVACPAE